MSVYNISCDTFNIIMCPGKTLSSALLFCLTCPRAMDAVREELSTINGEVFVRLLTSVNTFVGLVRLKQIVNMSILRFNWATAPDCHTFKRFLFHCFLSHTTWSCFSKKSQYLKGSSRDCAFSLCPSYSATSQDHRTNPGSTFTNSLGCFSNNIFVRLENMCCQLEVWFRW